MWHVGKGIFSSLRLLPYRPNIVNLFFHHYFEGKYLNKLHSLVLTVQKFSSRTHHATQPFPKGKKNVKLRRLLARTPERCFPDYYKLNIFKSIVSCYLSALFITYLIQHYHFNNNPLHWVVLEPFIGWNRSWNTKKYCLHSLKT